MMPAFAQRHIDLDHREAGAIVDAGDDQEAERDHQAGGNKGRHGSGEFTGEGQYRRERECGCDAEKRDPERQQDAGQEENISAHAEVFRQRAGKIRRQ